MMGLMEVLRGRFWADVAWRPNYDYQDHLVVDFRL